MKFMFHCILFLFLYNLIVAIKETKIDIKELQGIIASKLGSKKIMNTCNKPQDIFQSRTTNEETFWVG